MEHKIVMATIWWIFAVIMWVVDRKAGRETSQWVNVAIICSTIWAAA